ncbi:MAG: archaeal proteasome endopeptidase complex subunit alpha [Halorientalis sp.]
MQGQSQQQAYDRGITIFSPDGRLYQVEYAREAVKRGTASVGVRTDEGVVLAADTRVRSPLLERSSVEKLHKIDDHIGIASAGHVADARQLIDFARQDAQISQLRYDEPIDVETLTKDITDQIQQYTQTGGAQALAVGGNREDLIDFFEDEYTEDLDLDGGIDLALRGLATVGDEELDPEGVALGTVEVETEQYHKHTTDEVAAYLEDIDVGGDEE